MVKKSIYKVPGGKMVRISLNTHQGIIRQIKITGDFFLYPEKGINFLEAGLKNTPLNKLSLTVKRIIRDNQLKLFGLDAASIVQAIKLAIK